MYTEIRNKIMKNELIFNTIRFCFTPIRIVKEFIARRNMAKKLISKYSDIKKEDKKIFYFGVPEHNNLGDLAQTYCTRNWIKENYENYKVIEIRTRISFDKLFLSYIKDILGEDDIMLFQSGYCSRDTNLDHLMHVNIMEKFPYQKAVILPQTVNLRREKEIVRTKKVFEKCNRLLFIARDKISYEKAKDFIREEQLELYPDIVTSLIGRVKRNNNVKKGVLLCVRNDDEKFYSDSAIENTINELKKITDVVDKTDTNSHIDVWKTYENLEKIILDKIYSFEKYEVIITDRYHGTIFSLIANTPVIIIKTNDHKVTSGADWFDGIYSKESVIVADNLEEATKIATKYVSEKVRVNNEDYFYKNYYEKKLKNSLNNF